MGRSSVKPRVPISGRELTSVAICKRRTYSRSDSITSWSSLASQPYFSLFPVGGARGREKYPGTDCSTTLTSGGAIPSPSAQGDYPVREGGVVYEIETGSRGRGSTCMRFCMLQNWTL